MLLRTYRDIIEGGYVFLYKVQYDASSTQDKPLWDKEQVLEL